MTCIESKAQIESSMVLSQWFIVKTAARNCDRKAYSSRSRMLQPFVVRLITFASEYLPTMQTCTKAIQQCRGLVFIGLRPQCGIIRHLLPRGVVARVLWVMDKAWQYVTHLLHPSNKHGGQPGRRHVFHAITRTNTAPLEREEVMAPITMIQEKLELTTNLLLLLLADGTVGPRTKSNNRVILQPLSRAQPTRCPTLWAKVCQQNSNVQKLAFTIWS